MNFEGSDLVIKRFGQWPNFHDAEIKRLVLSTPLVHGDLASLEMVIHCWDLTSEIDSTGYYILKNRTLVTFRFEHLEEITIENFNHQNAVSTIEFENVAQESPGVVAWRVTVDPAFGADLQLSCQKIRVISAVPCDEEGREV